MVALRERQRDAVAALSKRLGKELEDHPAVGVQIANGVGRGKIAVESAARNLNRVQRRAVNLDAVLELKRQFARSHVADVAVAENLAVVGLDARQGRPHGQELAGLERF